jgi:hypothetical protein
MFQVDVIAAEEFLNTTLDWSADAMRPCWVCGWTCQQQARCRYRSSVKLVFGADACGVWTIGTILILKERPAGSPSNEAANIQFIRAQRSIPVPLVVSDWVDNGRQFTMLRISGGETLQTAWPKLTPHAIGRIAKQTAIVPQQLRELESRGMARLARP